MMFIDGLYHADPHPGNMLAHADGSLVLLDFGVRRGARALSESMREGIPDNAGPLTAKHMFGRYGSRIHLRRDGTAQCSNAQHRRGAVWSSAFFGSLLASCGSGDTPPLAPDDPTPTLRRDADTPALDASAPNIAGDASAAPVPVTAEALATLTALRARFAVPLPPAPAESDDDTDARDAAAPASVHNVHTGFTGREHDPEHGLINMRGRLYDPELGRFTTADPIVQAPYYSQSLNRYAYVFNNPLRFTDPSGFVTPLTRSNGRALGLRSYDHPEPVRDLHPDRQPR